MVKFHFNKDLYLNLGEQTRKKLDAVLVKFTKETLKKAKIPAKHIWVVLYGVFHLRDKDTRELTRYLGIKIHVDLAKFKEGKEFEAITIIEVDQHDSEVPDELLDFYNNTKEYGPQMVDLNS
jgi:hypothetical protein